MKKIKALLTAAGFMLLVLDAKTALAGSIIGVNICLQTVIPSMFPFILLANMVTSSLSDISLPVIYSFCKFLSIPQPIGKILFPVVLGGYPAGAQAVATCREQGYLSKEQADAMLPFCSIAGPAFIFGMVSQLFSHSGTAWYIWGIQLLGTYYASRFIKPQRISAEHFNSFRITNSNLMSLSINAMSKICGWIILFQIILKVLDRWLFWSLSPMLKILVSGFLELTSGCLLLINAQNEPLRFLLVNIFLSFGGLCVTMQTFSIVNGIRLKKYCYGRLLQLIFVIILSIVCIINRKTIPIFLLITIAAAAVKEKSCSNSRPASV